MITFVMATVELSDSSESESSLRQTRTFLSGGAGAFLVMRRRLHGRDATSMRTGSNESGHEGCAKTTCRACTFTCTFKWMQTLCDTQMTHMHAHTSTSNTRTSCSHAYDTHVCFSFTALWTQDMTKRERSGNTNAWPSSAAGSAEDKTVCHPWREKQNKKDPRLRPGPAQKKSTDSDTDSDCTL